MDIACQFCSQEDGRIVFCVRYHRFKAVKKFDRYAILRMEGCIDSLCETQMFSTLKTGSEHGQIKMDKRIFELPALMTHHCLFIYTRMPIGRKIFFGTFHGRSKINNKLVKWQRAFIYTDEIIFFEDT